MLTDNQRKAVDLLFELTDTEVAARLRISPDALEEWTRDPEFQQAVNDRLKENRQSVIRMLSRLYLDACRELSAIIHSDDEKNKHRVIVDILKSSGLLKEIPADDSDPIGALIARLSEEDDG